MDAELLSHKRNATWELVSRRTDTRSIGCRWVFAKKRDENGHVIRYKARLVAKGFKQKYGVDVFETYFPVANMNSIRVILAVCMASDYSRATGRGDSVSEQWPVGSCLHGRSSWSAERERHGMQAAESYIWLEASGVRLEQDHSQSVSAERLQELWGRSLCLCEAIQHRLRLRLLVCGRHDHRWENSERNP
ncbi:polyprotein [Phytophthora megakarya]|uniref:Polyprotein n=1 Tax=Phytophthora megakarya TaxID=4795 RepID=A0A225X097_9STRA|nr:polyprotein [Phytophthora megakarya]